MVTPFRLVDTTRHYLPRSNFCRFLYYITWANFFFYLLLLLLSKLYRHDESFLLRLEFKSFINMYNSYRLYGLRVTKNRIFLCIGYTRKPTACIDVMSNFAINKILYGGKKLCPNGITVPL